jgi:hypothetical protein
MVGLEVGAVAPVGLICEQVICDSFFGIFQSAKTTDVIFANVNFPT